ncbi:MAG: cytochrome c3 family protein [Chloroflexi bacterium]|nr:cytochrome c3 family protein [Chloroflexota bacterium]
MVKKNDNEIVEKVEEITTAKKNKRKQVWTVLGIVVLFLVIAGGATGGYLVYLSDTSPKFCSTCHIMDFNVNSYLTSNDMDNIHNQAGVQCKECHDYPVKAEITSGFKYVLGDYTVDDEGKLLPVSYTNDMCLQCHISYQHVAISTDYLIKNPHKSHNGELPCKTCHVSHGEQIDYCSQCHDNGGQRMLGDTVTSENPTTP